MYIKNHLFYIALAITLALLPLPGCSNNQHESIHLTSISAIEVPSAEALNIDAIHQNGITIGTAVQDTCQITVYITKTGSKYHRIGCPYLKDSSIAIDLSEAQKRYGPCSKCSPVNH